MAKAIASVLLTPVSFLAASSIRAMTSGRLMVTTFGILILLPLYNCLYDDRRHLATAGKAREPRVIAAADALHQDGPVDLRRRPRAGAPRRRGRNRRARPRRQRDDGARHCRAAGRHARRLAARDQGGA